jgi:hypothetical protein
MPEFTPVTWFLRFVQLGLLDAETIELAP